MPPLPDLVEVRRLLRDRFRCLRHSVAGQLFEPPRVPRSEDFGQPSVLSTPAVVTSPTPAIVEHHARIVRDAAIRTFSDDPAVRAAADEKYAGRNGAGDCMHGMPPVLRPL